MVVLAQVFTAAWNVFTLTCMGHPHPHHSDKLGYEIWCVDMGSRNCVLCPLSGGGIRHVVQ